MFSYRSYNFGNTEDPSNPDAQVLGTGAEGFLISTGSVYGFAKSITARMYAESGGNSAKCAIYNANHDTLIAYSETKTILNTDAAWITFALLSQPLLRANTFYTLWVMANIHENDMSTYVWVYRDKDDACGGCGMYSSLLWGDWPSTLFVDPEHIFNYQPLYVLHYRWFNRYDCNW